MTSHLLLLLSLTLHPALSLPLSDSNGNIYPEELGNHYQGDIVRPPLALSDRGVAVKPKTLYRWANGVVPYEFAANITPSNMEFIVSMMRAIENLTAVNGSRCVSFRPRAVWDDIFITIFNGSGCYAPVGNWGTWRGIRPVSLLDSPFASCMYPGVVQHELTHVLGMFHEQSRPDRDDYITINWDNIESEQKFNFDKYTNEQVDTQMTSYDYGSVMHYDRFAFAINRIVPTIIPTRNASASLGQRRQLSPTDIIEIQRYYDCIPTPMSTTTMTSRATTTPSSIASSSANPLMFNTTSNSNLQTVSTRNKATCTVFHVASLWIFFFFLIF